MGFFAMWAYGLMHFDPPGKCAKTIFIRCVFGRPASWLCNGLPNDYETILQGSLGGGGRQATRDKLSMVQEFKAFLKHEQLNDRINLKLDDRLNKIILFKFLGRSSSAMLDFKSFICVFCSVVYSKFLQKCEPINYSKTTFVQNKFFLFIPLANDSKNSF